MIKLRTALVASVPLALAGTLSPAQAQDVTIRFAHMNSPTHVVNVGGQQMADAVRQRTAGAVDIQMFPSGELGENTAIGEQISFGSDMIGQVGVGVLANYVPDFSIIVYPFLFDSFEQGMEFLDGEIVGGMEQQAETHNFKVLCYFAFGVRDLYTRDVEVRTPADSERLKIRVQPVTIYTEMVENAFLAAPTPMPWPEVYSALAQGVIDAAEAPPSAILDQKHYEHAKYLSQTNHILDISPVVMSLSTWNQLSGEQQSILQEEADSACRYMTEVSISNYDAGIEELRSRGMTIISDVDRAAFADGAQHIADAFPEWSEGLYDRVRPSLQQ